jgi:hypothetical protein
MFSAIFVFCDLFWFSEIGSGANPQGPAGRGGGQSSESQRITSLLPLLIAFMLPQALLLLVWLLSWALR